MEQNLHQFRKLDNWRLLQKKKSRGNYQQIFSKKKQYHNNEAALHHALLQWLVHKRKLVSNVTKGTRPLSNSQENQTNSSFKYPNIHHNSGYSNETVSLGSSIRTNKKIRAFPQSISEFSIITLSKFKITTTHTSRIETHLTRSPNGNTDI